MLLWPLLFKLIRKVLPAKAEAAVEHLSDELHHDLDLDADGHPIATAQAARQNTRRGRPTGDRAVARPDGRGLDSGPDPDDRHPTEGDTMTIVVGFTATTPGRAALRAAIG